MPRDNNPDRRRTYFDTGREQQGSPAIRNLDPPRITGNALEAFRRAARSIEITGNAFMSIPIRVDPNMPPGLIVMADASGNIIPARVDDPEGLSGPLGVVIGETLRAPERGIGRASSMVVNGQELGPGEISIAPFREPEESEEVLGRLIFGGSIDDRTTSLLSRGQGYTYLDSLSQISGDQVPMPYTPAITREDFDRMAEALPATYRERPRLEMNINIPREIIEDIIERSLFENVVTRAMFGRMQRDLERELIGLNSSHRLAFNQWDHEADFPDMRGGLRGPFEFGLIYDAFVWRLYNAKGKEEVNLQEFRTLLITTIGKVLEFRNLSITAQRLSFSDDQIRRQFDGRKSPNYMVFGRRNGKLIVNYEPLSTWQENEFVHLSVNREELEDFMTMITLLATGEFVKYEIKANRKGDEKERLIRATCNQDALEEDEVE
jgi:hypothetical protein